MPQTVARPLDERHLGDQDRLQPSRVSQHLARNSGMERNLLLRGVGTFILSAPLLWLYTRAKRSVLARRTA
jgi:hypothetical protein